MNQRPTKDETEAARREAVSVINANPKGRPEPEANHGEVWDTDELRRDFDVLSFAAPLVVVLRKRDGKLGSLYFQHSPRFYFGFATDE
jgi:hypothetical protein